MFELQELLDKGYEVSFSRSGPGVMASVGREDFEEVAAYGDTWPQALRWASPLSEDDKAVRADWLFVESLRDLSKIMTGVDNHRPDKT